MRIKKFIIVFFISILTFSKTPQAVPIELTVTYKQGIYDLTKFEGFYDNIKLLTPNNPVTIIITDSAGKLKYYYNLKGENAQIKLGPLEKGDIGVLIGAGEVIVTHTKP